MKHIRVSNSEILHETYIFGDILGKGCFGTVVSVSDKSDDRQWALKIVPKTMVCNLLF